MSHHIYNTDAIVLGSTAVGETDRSVWLLTRDSGLLVARAQGARKEESKMRYSLQEYSLVQVSLVAGKAGWRVTGAVLEHSFIFDLKKQYRLSAAAKISDLLKRFVPRDEPNAELFNIVLNGLIDLDETLLVALILQNLGYLHGEAPAADRSRTALLVDINEAIAHADL